MDDLDIWMENATANTSALIKNGKGRSILNLTLVDDWTWHTTITNNKNLLSN